MYNVSAGRTVPQWLSESKKRSLRKDEEYRQAFGQMMTLQNVVQASYSRVLWYLHCRRRLELIQDFEFPAASHRLKATPDGQYIYASGIHPPRVRSQEHL